MERMIIPMIHRRLPVTLDAVCRPEKSKYFPRIVANADACSDLSQLRSCFIERDFYFR